MWGGGGQVKFYHYGKRGGVGGSFSRVEGRAPGGAMGPTQRSCVYLVVQGTTWSPRNGSMKGIFN